MSPLVLVVDDDLDVREAMTDTLEIHGYRVVTARHGAEGLQRVSETRPDVVLLDLAMPVMDGSQFAAALRSGGGEEIPVVVMSAAANPRRAVHLGARAYLEKPFEVEELLHEVASASSKP